jgi:UrcA family protein
MPFSTDAPTTVRPTSGIKACKKRIRFEAPKKIGTRVGNLPGDKTMQKKTTLTTTLFATAAAGMMLSATAAADDNISFKLSYADLDLTTTAGIVELHDRIDTAGRKACGIRVGTNRNSLLEWRQERACYEAVVDAALERIEQTSKLRIAAADLDAAVNSES